MQEDVIVLQGAKTVDTEACLFSGCELALMFNLLGTVQLCYGNGVVAAKCKTKHQSTVNWFKHDVLDAVLLWLHNFSNRAGLHTPSWRASGQARVCLQLSE